MSKQLEMAQLLADELEICGYEDITAMDILDCLAFTGLKLSRSRSNTASKAYFKALTA